MSRDNKWASNDKDKLLVENFKKFMEEGDFSSKPEERHGGIREEEEEDNSNFLANMAQSSQRAREFDKMEEFKKVTEDILAEMKPYWHGDLKACMARSTKRNASGGFECPLMLIQALLPHHVTEKDIYSLFLDGNNMLKALKKNYEVYVQTGKPLGENRAVRRENSKRLVERAPNEEKNLRKTFNDLNLMLYNYLQQYGPTKKDDARISEAFFEMLDPFRQKVQKISTNLQDAEQRISRGARW